MANTKVSALIAATVVFGWFSTQTSMGLAQGVAAGRSILHVDGTFQGMARMVVKVTDAEGTEILVQLPQDPSKMRFHADADPQGIRPGMMLRFNASFGPGGVPLEAVKQIEVFHPIRTAGLPRHAAEAVTPGLYPEGNAPPNRNGGFVPGKYRVVGSLAGMAPGGWIAVAAGQAPVRVMVDPAAKFYIRTNSLELAQPGDRVSLDGFYNEPDKTKVLAESLTISTDRLIGTPQEPELKGRRRRDKNEEEKVPAAERAPKAAAEAGAGAAAEAGAAAAEAAFNAAE